METTALLGVIQTILVALGGVLWFMFKDLKQKHEGMSKSFDAFKLEVAKQYMPKSELQGVLDKFERKIEEGFKNLMDEIKEIKREP